MEISSSENLKFTLQSHDNARSIKIILANKFAHATSEPRFDSPRSRVMAELKKTIQQNHDERHPELQTPSTTITKFNSNELFDTDQNGQEKRTQMTTTIETEMCKDFRPQGIAKEIGSDRIQNSRNEIENNGKHTTMDSSDDAQLSGSFETEDSGSEYTDNDEEEGGSPFTVVSDYIKGLVHSNNTFFEGFIAQHQGSFSDFNPPSIARFFPSTIPTAQAAAKKVVDSFATCCGPRKEIEPSAAQQIQELLPPKDSFSYISFLSPLRPGQSSPKHYYANGLRVRYEVIPASTSEKAVRSDAGISMHLDQSSHVKNSIHSSVSRALIGRLGDLKLVVLISAVGPDRTTVADFLALGFARRLLERLQYFYRISELEEHTVDLTEPVAPLLRALTSIVSPLSVAVTHEEDGAGRRWLNRMATILNIPAKAGTDTGEAVEMSSHVKFRLQIGDGCEAEHQLPQVSENVSFERQHDDRSVHNKTSEEVRNEKRLSFTLADLGTVFDGEGIDNMKLMYSNRTSSPSTPDISRYQPQNERLSPRFLLPAVRSGRRNKNGSSLMSSPVFAAPVHTLAAESIAQEHALNNVAGDVTSSQPFPHETASKELFSLDHRSSIGQLSSYHTPDPHPESHRATNPESSENDFTVLQHALTVGHQTSPRIKHEDSVTSNHSIKRKLARYNFSNSSNEDDVALPRMFLDSHRARASPTYNVETQSQNSPSLPAHPHLSIHPMATAETAKKSSISPLTADMIEQILLHVITVVGDDFRRKMPIQSQKSGGCVTILMNQKSTGMLGVGHVGNIRAVLAKAVQSPTSFVSEDTSWATTTGHSSSSRPHFEIITITSDHTPHNVAEVQRVALGGARVKAQKTGRGVVHYKHAYLTKTDFTVGVQRRRMRLRVRGNAPEQAETDPAASDHTHQVSGTTIKYEGDHNFIYNEFIVKFPDPSQTSLTYTRGIGFSPLTDYGFSSVPDLIGIQLAPLEKGFVVVASPPIWETFDNSQAIVDFIADEMYINNRTPEDAASALVDNVLSFWSLTRTDPPGDLVCAILPINVTATMDEQTTAESTTPTHHTRVLDPLRWLKSLRGEPQENSKNHDS